MLFREGREVGPVWALREADEREDRVLVGVLRLGLVVDCWDAAREVREADEREDRVLVGAFRLGLGVDPGDAVAEPREVDARDRFLSGAVRFGLGVDPGDAVAEPREADARDWFLSGAVRFGLGVELEGAVADSRRDERVVSSTAALERAVRSLLARSLASTLSTLFNRSVLSLLRLCLLFASLSLEVTRPTSARGRGGAGVDSEFLRLLRGSRVSDLADSPSVARVSEAVC